MTTARGGTIGDVAWLVEDRIGTVELRRPPHNFFDIAFLVAIGQAIAAVHAQGARAIVLCASGTAFCAGADFSAGAGQGDHVERARQLYAAAAALFDTPVPVVAAIEGPAVGGGLGLALTADVRVAGPRARFSANFVLLGIHPGFGVTLTLPRLIGEQRAALMMLTGRRVDVTTAMDWGLVDERVAAEDVRPRARAIAAEIAAAAPLAVASTRHALRGALAAAVLARTEHERAEQARLMLTEDHLEGVRAVSARRPGDFSGR